MPSDDARQRVQSALTDLSAGDATATDRLLPIVYAELRSIAASLLRKERSDHTLQATALVHEAWLRLGGARSQATWKDVAHFKAVAVRAMRRVLVDHARRRRTDKRGSDPRRVTLSGDELVGGGGLVDLLVLDEALQRLATVHARQARVVELRFLGGLTVNETAHVLSVSVSTVKADWALAQEFLADEIGDPAG